MKKELLLKKIESAYAEIGKKIIENNDALMEDKQLQLLNEQESIKSVIEGTEKTLVAPSRLLEEVNGLAFSLEDKERLYKITIKSYLAQVHLIENEGSEIPDDRLEEFINSRRSWGQINWKKIAADFLELKEIKEIKEIIDQFEEFFEEIEGNNNLQASETLENLECIISREYISGIAYWRVGSGDYISEEEYNEVKDSGEGLCPITGEKITDDNYKEATTEYRLALLRAMLEYVKESRQALGLDNALQLQQELLIPVDVNKDKDNADANDNLLQRHADLQKKLTDFQEKLILQKKLTDFQEKLILQKKLATFQKRVKAVSCVLFILGIGSLAFGGLGLLGVIPAVLGAMSTGVFAGSAGGGFVGLVVGGGGFWRAKSVAAKSVAAGPKNGVVPPQDNGGGNPKEQQQGQQHNNNGQQKQQQHNFNPLLPPSPSQ